MRWGVAWLVLVAALGCAQGALRAEASPMLAETALACPPATSVRNGRIDELTEQWCADADGTMHGPYRSWHPNGRLRSTVQYREGREHGPTRSWHPNGPLALRANTKDGVLHGGWVEWHSNGQVANRATFEQGELVGVAVWWYPSGG